MCPTEQSPSPPQAYRGGTAPQLDCSLPGLDLLPLCLTFLLCFWEVQYGILAGTLVSVLILLHSVARPKMQVPAYPFSLQEGSAGLGGPGGVKVPYASRARSSALRSPHFCRSGWGPPAWAGHPSRAARSDVPPGHTGLPLLCPPVPRCQRGRCWSCSQPAVCTSPRWRPSGRPYSPGPWKVRGPG